jgi:hypothetical protein
MKQQNRNKELHFFSVYETTLPQIPSLFRVKQDNEWARNWT